MKNVPNLLLIEDDRIISQNLTEFLSQEGFRIQHAFSGKEALVLLDSSPFDLLILDVNLPDFDGYHICQEFRKRNTQTPILMLTAYDELEDKMKGFEMGADDYLPKPFNPRELSARIGAILRRRGVDEHPGAPSHEHETIHFGPFTLNMGTRTLMRGGVPVDITTGEFSVLKVFGRHPRVPLSRDKLMELARGREYEAFDRSLDVQISRLRKLIEVNPAKPAYIQTVWGMGYVFVPDGNR